jgi:hypothetical protein
MAQAQILEPYAFMGAQRVLLDQCVSITNPPPGLFPIAQTRTRPSQIRQRLQQLNEIPHHLLEPIYRSINRA